MEAKNIKMKFRNLQEQKLQKMFPTSGDLEISSLSKIVKKINEIKYSKLLS